MRPQGEICEAVVQVIYAHGPCSLRDVADRARVSGVLIGCRAVRWTLRNALARGDVVLCGHVRQPHAKRWCALYDLSEAAYQALDSAHASPAGGGAAASAGAVLAAALSAWRGVVDIEPSSLQFSTSGAAVCL